ncbi:MAG: 3-oxoacyl-[acyl-carrier-protein] reductase [Nitrospinae bacterium]|nr:3-oxoacyl-[acyl-carrier-protein] reductase [Nitrospinota bacterium]
MSNEVRKSAIVTGAAQGIGREIALLLAKNGIDIVVTDISDGSDTVKEMEKLGVNAISITGNVANPDDADMVVEKCIERFGKVDILINNAGITRDSLLLRMKKEAWDAVIGVNLTGVFNFTKAVVKYMIKQKSGRIVNISSIVGVMGNVGQVNYSASKAGVIGLTKSVAREVASRGVTVNAVAPGFIETDMTRALPDNERNALTAVIPMKKLGQVEDVAQAVLFLVSDGASYITGQVINVNGGMYM